MSQYSLNHGRKFFRSGWWFILLAVFLFVAVVAWNSSYYSVITKYELNNFINDPSEVVNFKIQNTRGEINDVDLERKYIHELEFYGAYKARTPYLIPQVKDC